MEEQRREGEMAVERKAPKLEVVDGITAFTAYSCAGERQQGRCDRCVSSRRPTFTMISG